MVTIIVGLHRSFCSVQPYESKEIFTFIFYMYIYKFIFSNSHIFLIKPRRASPLDFLRVLEVR